MFDTYDIHGDSESPFVNYIYTDNANLSIITNIENTINSPIKFIIRDTVKWDVRYITNVIVDPNVKIIVINNIDEMSIAEITLASFMCKTILCTTNTIKEYNKIYNMITDLQTGCNLTINNNSFSNWYKSKRF